MENEIAKAINQAAEQDLNLARRHGCMTVAQTKRGNVDVSYEDGVYAISGVTVVSADRVDRWEIKGPRRVVKAALMPLYVVES